MSATIPPRLVTAARLARYWFREPIKAHLRRVVNGRRVSTVQLRQGLTEAQHVVVMVVHDEAHRLDFLLDYYRGLGFGHFLVIDHDSTDGTVEKLLNVNDVSLFRTTASYKNARYGLDWVNFLLNRHCRSKWVLHVDADEYLVYGVRDGARIRELTDILESRRQDVLHTMMLDMYSHAPLAANVCPPGADPLEVCSHYDSTGYVCKFDEMKQTTWIKGGPRARLFFPSDVMQGPALNKTPLVLWRPHFAFVKSTHQLFPPRLNGPGRTGVGRIEGVLLHFKFLSNLSEQLHSERTRRQHTDEYAAYQRVEEMAFVAQQTQQYTGWRDLVANGIMTVTTTRSPSPDRSMSS